MPNNQDKTSKEYGVAKKYVKKKAIRKTIVTVEVGGDHYSIERVIEGTRKLSQYIVFQDGSLMGRRKIDPHIYDREQEKQMEFMITQLVFEASKNFWP